MKKLIALLLALAMVACFFAGCAKDDTQPTDPPETQNGEETKGDTSGKQTLKIIYVTPSTASDFWSQVETGIKQALKDYEAELGITIEYSTMGPAEEVDAEAISPLWKAPSPTAPTPS